MDEGGNIRGNTLEENPHPVLSPVSTYGEKMESKYALCPNHAFIFLSLYPNLHNIPSICENVNGRTTSQYLRGGNTVSLKRQDKTHQNYDLNNSKNKKKKELKNNFKPLIYRFGPIHNNRLNVLDQFISMVLP